MATGKQAHLVSKYVRSKVVLSCLPLRGRHDAEQQDSDYLQLHTTHTDKTTLLRTKLLTKCACLPVAIYITCTPDEGWDCHPKHAE